MYIFIEDEAVGYDISPLKRVKFKILTTAGLWYSLE
jgi:hypothetical protein